MRKPWQQPPAPKKPILKKGSKQKPVTVVGADGGGTLPMASRACCCPGHSSQLASCRIAGCFFGYKVHQLGSSEPARMVAVNSSRGNQHRLKPSALTLSFLALPLQPPSPSAADPVRQSQVAEKRKEWRQGLQDFIKQQRQVKVRPGPGLWVACDRGDRQVSNCESWKPRRLRRSITRRHTLHMGAQFKVLQVRAVLLNAPYSALRCSRGLTGRPRELLEGPGLLPGAPAAPWCP